MNLPRRVQKFGDTTFGIPDDMPQLHQPWGFYELLGVPKDATHEDIKKSYRKLAIKAHPDKGGDSESFRNLQMVYDILTDDGGELGIEHSQRSHYDRVSSIDEHFDGFLTIAPGENGRTRKLSEIILIQLEGRKKQAEQDRELTEIDPEYPIIKAEFEQVAKEANNPYASQETKKRAEKLRSRIRDIAVKQAGITPEQADEIDKQRENAQQAFIQQQKDAIDKLQTRPKDYSKKVFDIYHLFGGTVEFGTNQYQQRVALVGIEDHEQIVRMIIGENNYFVGIPQIHFKSEDARVRISDPHIIGIVDVVKGTVIIDYQDVSYGAVIKVNAPTMYAMEGFESHDGLFTPERFAIGEWWTKEPDLTVNVMDGMVTLTARTQIFAPKISKSIYGSSLEDLIKEKYNNNLYNIINNDKKK